MSRFGPVPPIARLMARERQRWWRQPVDLDNFMHWEMVMAAVVFGGVIVIAVVVIVVLAVF